MEYFIANITSSCVNNFMAPGSPSKVSKYGVELGSQYTKKANWPSETSTRHILEDHSTVLMSK